MSMTPKTRNWGLSVASACFLLARGFAADSSALDQARIALAENLPQIALQKLANLPASPETVRLRAEAQLAAGQPDAALSTLAPLLPNGNYETALLHAHALARRGRWHEARASYTRLASHAGAPLSARLGLAESCQAVGDTPAAIAILERIAEGAPASVRLRLAGLHVEVRQGARARKLLAATKLAAPADRLWARYVEGRLLLLEEQAAAAHGAFSEILNARTDLTENLFVAASLGAIDAKIILQGNEAGDKELETFIWRYPDSAWLELVFSRLDQVYASEKNPQESELQKWAKKPQQRRAALAQFYVARMQVRERKWEKALVSLDTFVRSFPAHQFAPFAHLLRADVLLEKGDFDSAVRALEAAARSAGRNDMLRGEVELRTGLVQLRQREFVLAAQSFSTAAERNAALSMVAHYDAALAWLNQGNFDRFIAEYSRLSERGASGELRGNLVLEEGLVRARLGDPFARQSLRRFLDQFPSHPRIGEARLADAELSFVAHRFTEASHLLQVANEKILPEKTDDHTAYLALFLADSKKPRDDAEVIRLAKSYLRERPNSALRDEVRMKLGQVYFRQPDYPNAETQFASLAQESPQSAYSETALFLAGQSAMRTINTGSTERALGYFDKVVERGGPLKFHAREQQAIIQGKLGKETEAIALYELILNAKPSPDAELRAAALLGKGSTLASLGKKDPVQLEAAVAVFSELAAFDEASPARRYQGLYEKGRALDQLGKKAEAIAAYNDALDRNLTTAVREFFWFYKSGFEAARHYEQQASWPSAIAIYEKMARVEGPRAAEARTRARQLRVEHFVWD